MSTLKAGTVLMQIGTYLPQSLSLDADGYCEGWNEVKNLNGSTLDRKLRGSNWNFVHVSGTLEASMRGPWNGVTLRKAAIRLLAKAKRTQLNCLEITHVAQRRFLGIRYVTIVGHSRHVQEGSQLESLPQRRLHLEQALRIATARAL